jgi:hypothetical protein
MKIVFDKPVKYKGKKIEANKIIEINENEKVDLLNCGAFIVQPGVIGVNKKGDRIIIDFVPEVEDNKQAKKEGKKENKGRK